MVLILIVNRAVRIWSLKEKKLKSTMRGHTDEIEVNFVILLQKNLVSTQEKLDTFNGFSLHVESLDVHVVSMLIDTGILSRTLISMHYCQCIFWYFNDHMAALLFCTTLSL